MPYTPNPDWEDSPSTDTPITAAALQRMEDGIETAQAAAEAAQSTADGAYSAGGTDVPITDGGTGASTAADARTNLGVPAAANPIFTGTTTLDTGLTGVLRADSGVVSADGDVTDIVTAASLTAAGKVELATVAETDTGTDATRAVTPAGLAGSALATKVAGIEALADVTDATNVDAAGAVMNTDTSTAAMQFVVDEDTMTSDSATKVPTQQSTKAYVDAHLNDTADAHDASAISIVDAGARFASTDVEGALGEAYDEALNAYIDTPSLEDGPNVAFTLAGSPPSETLTPYTIALPKIIATRRGATVTASTTATSVLASTIVPAANSIAVSDGLEFEVYGTTINNTGGNDTVTFRMRCGTGNFSNSSAITLATSANVYYWRLRGFFFIDTSTAVAGVVTMTMGQLTSSDTTDLLTRTEGPAAGAGLTTDLTNWSSYAFDVTVQHGSTSASLVTVGGFARLLHIPAVA